MAERDGASIYVDLGAIETKFFFYCQILPGESFVDLDQVHVLKLQSGFFQRCPRGRYGPTAHDLWINPGNAPAHDASHGLKATLLRLIQSHHHRRCAAIDDAAGITSRDRSV